MFGGKTEPDRDGWESISYGFDQSNSISSSLVDEEPEKDGETSKESQCVSKEPQLANKPVDIIITEFKNDSSLIIRKNMNIIILENNLGGNKFYEYETKNLFKTQKECISRIIEGLTGNGKYLRIDRLSIEINGIFYGHKTDGKVTISKGLGYKTNKKAVVEKLQSVLTEL